MKIGIATMTTGFNYGTSLQAYATKLNLEKMGYNPEILGYKGSFVKGRDVRLKKIFAMFYNTMLNPNLLKKTYKTYKKKIDKEITTETKNLFEDFTKNKLEINKLSYKEMQKYAHSDNTHALICGSDQIWSLSSVYVDPFYYLNFAPKYKRISYAPSFGNIEIQDYNKKIIAKYLKGFDRISIREKTGKNIVQQLIGKEAEVHIDPTLLIDSQQWKVEMKRIDFQTDYALVYFLDTPTDIAIKGIEKKIKELGVKKIIVIPNNYEKLRVITDNIELYSAGPLEFLSLVYNSKIVFTDSYHGMLFSINFNKEFFIFERDYGIATSQSSRIESILDILNLKNRFLKKELNFNNKIEWATVNKTLIKEREKSTKYLKECLKEVGEKNAK